jgi:hypothetical protein
MAASALVVLRSAATPSNLGSLAATALRQCLGGGATISGGTLHKAFIETGGLTWEDWHYGYVAGPAPCSAEGDRVGAGGAAEPPAGSPDGRGSGIGLPSFVPARFREAIAAAAQRWDVSGALLAAQLMAESNFNPFAVSPAGAAGIAQFMPGTAAAYGLDDPFDAEAAIDAQAHLMSDLLEQFGDVSLALAAYNAGPGAVEPCMCIPDYPETQAYVARIVGLMRGAGATVVAGGPPPLEVRLVE